MDVKNTKENIRKKTSIGGQALIEGIMMRGPKLSAMSVRTPSGEISTETWDTKGTAWYAKIPVARGVFNFVSTLLFGYKCLMKSAEIAGFEDEEEPGKFEKWLQEKFGDALYHVITGVVMVLSVILCIGLFMIVPSFLVSLVRPLISSQFVLALIEGIIKIGVFLAYLILVSKMPDIKRVFQYHGAEHKTIACYEAGEDLTVENIRKCSRFHPRCGTSFILIVLVVSVLVFSLVTWSSVWMRTILKILLMPVVVGLAYEVIKFAGRHDNACTRVISAPGLWLQKFTTYEPDDTQIEVAIAAMTPVIPQNDADDRW